MSPYFRNVLLEALYGFEHLVWAYRSELDVDPSAYLTRENVCLADYSNRSADLIRILLDQDNARRGERPQFKPPLSQLQARLRPAMVARRAAQAKDAAVAAPSTAPPPEPPPDAPLPTLDEPVTDAVPTDVEPNVGLTNEEVRGQGVGVQRPRMRPR